MYCYFKLAGSIFSKLATRHIAYEIQYTLHAHQVESVQSNRTPAVDARQRGAARVSSELQQFAESK